MADELFTPGETSGITQIPPHVIRRYVIDFKDCFSPGVQKPRGRRFNNQDINKLLLIRKMRSNHKKHDQIAAALNDEIPNVERIDHSDALKIVDAARKEYREIRAINYDCWNAQRKAKELTRRFESSLTNRDMIPALIDRIDTLEKEFYKLREEMTYKEFNKGFLARILGA